MYKNRIEMPKRKLQGDRVNLTVYCKNGGREPGSKLAAAADKKVKIGDLCEDVWFVDT